MSGSLPRPVPVGCRAGAGRGFLCPEIGRLARSDRPGRLTRPVPHFANRLPDAVF